MPPLLITALLVAAVVVCFRASVTAVAVVLVSTWMLVPGAARIPGMGESQFFLHRVVTAIVLLAVLWRVLVGRLDRDVFAVRGIHVAFGAYLAVITIVGVVAAPPSAPAVQNVNGWIDIVAQFAFFLAALAVFRACGARRSVQVIASVAAVMAVVAVSERLFGWSYAKWFASRLDDPLGYLSLPLEQRGPQLRVRAAASFALEFAWMTALLIPMSIAAARSWRPRRWPWAVPPLLVWALVWSVSRSAYAGLAIGMMVLLFGITLDRPRQSAIVAAAGLVVAAIVARAPINEAIQFSTLKGEHDVRLDRLPGTFRLVSDRPFSGLGLGGLTSRGLLQLDVSWATTYATIGVLGLVTLAAVLLAAIHATSRFVLAGPDDRRVIAAAAAGAALAAPVGLAAFDFATLSASMKTLWALVAVGLVANEELGVLQPLRRVPRRVPLPLVPALGLLGVVAGWVVLLAAPVRSATELVYTTVDPQVIAEPNYEGVTVKVLSQTACSVLDELPSAASIECRDLDQLAGGIGVLRIEGRDAAQVSAAQSVVEKRLTDVFPAATVQVSQQGRGRPAWATTAPLWLGALAAGLASLIPSGGGTDLRRRRPAERSPSHAPSRAPTPGG